MSTEGSKRCPKCEEVKPVHEFPKNRCERDGLGCYCKRCQNRITARNRERHRKNFSLGLVKPVAEKKCCSCKTVKPAAMFGKVACSAGGLNPQCKECRSKALRKRKYGISEGEYRALASNQSEVCAICRSADAEHVDHCHSTGVVRGLLCRPCNCMLGNAKDNESTLFAAIHYLRNPPAYQILKKDDPRK